MDKKMFQYACSGLLSKEMEDYLENHIDEQKALSIITGAPISLKEKLTRLEQLCSKLTDTKVIEDTEGCMSIIVEALSEIEFISNKGIILAESCWQDYDDGNKYENINHSRHIPPCSSYDDLLEAILDEIEFETGIRSFESDIYTWYEFQIWNMKTLIDGRVRYEIGKYKYIMIGKEVCYLEPSDVVYKQMHSDECWIDLCGSTDLNLPVPFESGSIVKVDCLPFADIEHILILDSSSNLDCCGLRGAFINLDGNIEVGAVKHGHCFPKYYRPRLSPLYRMESFHGLYSEEEKLLFEIQEDMMKYNESDRNMYGRIYENINRTYSED